MKEKIIGKLVAYTTDRATAGYVTINELLYVRCYSMADLLSEPNANNILQLKRSSDKTWLRLPKVKFTGDESKLRVYMGSPARVIRNTSIIVAFNRQNGYVVLLSALSKFREIPVDMSSDTGEINIEAGCKLEYNLNDLVEIPGNTTFEELMAKHKDCRLIREENRKIFPLYTEDELLSAIIHVMPYRSRDKLLEAAVHQTDVQRSLLIRCKHTPTDNWEELTLHGQIRKNDVYVMNEILSHITKYSIDTSCRVYEDALSKGHSKTVNRLANNRNLDSAFVRLSSALMSMGPYYYCKEGTDAELKIKDLYNFVSNFLLAAYIAVYYPLMYPLEDKQGFLSDRCIKSLTDTVWMKSLVNGVLEHIAKGENIPKEEIVSSSLMENTFNTLVSKLYLPLDYYECIIRYAMDEHKPTLVPVQTLYTQSALVISQFMLFITGGVFSNLPMVSSSIKALKGGLSVRNITESNLKWMSLFCKDMYRHKYLLIDRYNMLFNETIKEYDVLKWKKMHPKDDGYSEDILELTEHNLNELGYTLNKHRDKEKYITSMENRYTLKYIGWKEKTIDELKKLGAKTIGDAIVLGAVQKYESGVANPKVFDELAYEMLKASIMIFNPTLYNNCKLQTKFKATDEIIESAISEETRTYYNSGFCLYRIIPKLTYHTGSSAEVESPEFGVNAFWCYERGMGSVGKKTFRYIYYNYIDKKLVNLKRFRAHTVVMDEHIEALAKAFHTGLRTVQDVHTIALRTGNMRYI